MIRVSSLIGTNIHNIALGIIGCRETVEWYQYDTREINEDGYQVASYKPAITVKNCSVIPVNHDMYKEGGRDLQKTSWHLRIPANIKDVNRDTSGDKFVWRGRTYKPLSNMELYYLDGWLTAEIVLDDEQ